MPIKISQLENTANVNANDLIPIVDSSDSEMSADGSTKNIKASDLANELVTLETNISFPVQDALLLKTSLSTFANSLTANGYQRLPGGLIIQWGKNLDTNVAINFPIEFPTAGLCMVGSATPASDQSADATVEIISRTQFKLRLGSALGNQEIYWIALGY